MVYFIPLSIYLFYQLINDQPTDNIRRFPVFWVNTAVLIYFSGNFFLFLAYSFFTFKRIYALFYPIHSILNALKNMMFGIALIFQYLNTRKVAACGSEF